MCKNKTIVNKHWLRGFWSKKHLVNGRFTDTVVGNRNHGGLGQCYKTFFVRNLRTFEIRWSVCPWKVLSA
jgi:hypothetical protein